MIKNSREWARARGLLQRNEVHGREEWKIPTSRKFAYDNKTKQQTKQTGVTTVEDCWPTSSPRSRTALILFPKATVFMQVPEKFTEHAVYN